MKGHTGSRVALGWWGSFPDGGPTVGDLLALQAACGTVAGLGAQASVICDAAFLPHVAAFAPIPYVAAAKYDAFVWVCGPLIGGSSQFRRLFDRFDGIPRIAVGVSVLPQNAADHFDGFDVCIARDGVAESYGDLALAVPVRMPNQVEHGRWRKNRVALCLRGAQREYGTERCDHVRVDALCGRLVEAMGLDATVIDTRLDRSEVAPNLLEENFLTSRLVITSRLHGALLALRHGTPVLAIDQIVGGGKVHEVLSRLGWPWVYRSDLVEADQLVTEMQVLLEHGAGESIARARIAAEMEAESALQALAHCLGECLAR